MSKTNIINDIPMREAETKQERLILGLLAQESERIGFGKLTIEFSIRAGSIDRATLTESSRMVNIGLRDVQS